MGDLVGATIGDLVGVLEVAAANGDLVGALVVANGDLVGATFGATVGDVAAATVWRVNCV
jgi:hypothetical protein